MEDPPQPITGVGQTGECQIGEIHRQEMSERQARSLEQEYYLYIYHYLNLETTDASLTADPGVASLITARSNTFIEIDHKIISTVILLPSAESFKKGLCQLQAKVCARSTG